MYLLFIGVSWKCSNCHSFLMPGFAWTLNCSSPTPGALFRALEKDLFSKKLHRPVKSINSPLWIKVGMTVVGILSVVRGSDKERPFSKYRESIFLCPSKGQTVTGSWWLLCCNQAAGDNHMCTFQAFINTFHFPAWKGAIFDNIPVAGSGKFPTQPVQ